MYFVQADQVNGYCGLDNLGVEQYATLQDFYNLKAFTEGNILPVTLATDTNVVALGAGSFPAGLAYVDGSALTSLNGSAGLAVGTLGASDLTTTLVAGKEANVWAVLDENDDDLLEVGGLKRVYAIATTDLADGDTIGAGNVQLSFVIRDDVTNGWTPYTVVAGNYQFIPTEVWGIGSSIVNGTFGKLLSSAGGNKLNEITESYEELLNVFPSPFRSQTYLQLDTMTALQADKQVVLSVVGGVASFTDSASTALTGTAYSTDDLAFPLEVSLGGVNEANGFVNGIRVDVGGLEVSADKIAVTGANEITVDCSDVLGTLHLYKDTRITVSW